MIKSLYTIGTILQKQEEYVDYFRPWANPFPKIFNPPIVIIAEINNGVLGAKLQMEKFSNSLVDKYLFREAKANATNIVPTFYLQSNSNYDKYVDNVRKVVKKIGQSIDNYKHIFLTKPQIQDIEQLLIAKFPLNSDNSYLFTMRIDNKYFGDFEEFKELFYQEAYQKYSKDSSAKNKLCAITYQESPEVWGRVDTLGFTVNDIAFSRNGFYLSESFKMFPVSPEAVKVLEGSKRIVLEKLSKNFFGLKYFVLPRFIILDESLQSELLLNDFIDLYSKNDNTLESQSNAIIQNEDIFQEIVESSTLSKNEVYYDIFFYQQNQAQFLIKVHLSDVLPSRFREILEAKRNIENMYSILTEIYIPPKKKEIEKRIKYFLTFSEIKNFFSKKVKTDTIFQPYFYKILEAVFYENYLNEEQILKAFQTEIVKAFKNSTENPYAFAQTVKESFVIFQYFCQLNLFKQYIKKDMENTTQKTVALNLNDFEQQHPEFFNDTVRKAAFYLGCLTEKLLEKQRENLKSEPFRKYLNGLSLDLEQLRKVYAKLKDKINQYNDKFYPDELDYMQNLEVGLAMPLANKTTNLSKTDLSYAFSVGMVMQKEFTKEKIHFAKLAKSQKEKGINTPNN